MAGEDMGVRKLGLGVRAIGLMLMLALSRAGAQDYVTTGSVYLRRTPSNTGAKIRILAAAETLSARAVPERPGFVAVRTSDGKAGWVGESKVRDLRAEALSAGTLVAADPAGAATRIDSTWAKPPVQTSTIKVKTGADRMSCGAHGKSAKPDDGTNFQKNRNDVPATSHLVTLDAIRALNDTPLHRIRGLPPHRTRWKGSDSALVTPYEGIPVTVEGYFEVIKTQSGGGGESPNCNASLERDTDWHIALIADPSETEAQAVVVEPTPRSKRRNVGWTPQKASSIAVRHSDKSQKRDEANALRVRVTGFLMLDPVHPNHIGEFRATLWEVHPVTKIEVFSAGAWVNLNDYQPPL